MTKLQSVLVHRTPRSALLLREFFGLIRLVPVPVDAGTPYYRYYRSMISLDVLAVIETPPEGGASEGHVQGEPRPAGRIL